MQPKQCVPPTDGSGDAPLSAGASAGEGEGAGGRTAGPSPAEERPYKAAAGRNVPGGKRAETLYEATRALLKKRERKLLFLKRTVRWTLQRPAKRLLINQAYVSTSECCWTAS